MQILGVIEKGLNYWGSVSVQRRSEIPDKIAGNLILRNRALLLAYKAQANLEYHILGIFAVRSCMKLVMGVAK